MYNASARRSPRTRAVRRRLTLTRDERLMNIALGIDTGGTFTDAVLVEHETGRVLAGAKALTTRHNLALGIEDAIRSVLAASAQAGTAVALEHISLVALSTTLATNALAEGQHGTVCLLLVGYDPELIEGFGFRDELATDDIVYLQGGHDVMGNEVAPLDEEAARAAILARRNAVEAFAVSGYFAVRNPEHELRLRALVEELTGLPVTCGHELTSRLDAVRRATTVALNAHLIVPLRELMTSVDKTLQAIGITAPLMVVKGDGSLVRVQWATRRPIETILSGPAASVVGAWHLAGRRDMWVVDVGGTTTDIAALRNALPILNEDGASVGGWRTMIEAVDVHTTGLGGDSRVSLDAGGGLRIGPRRVIPLSLLASEHPGILDGLRRVAALPPGRRPDEAAEFLVAGRQADMALADEDREVLDRLRDGPLSLCSLADDAKRGWLLGRRAKEMETRGLVRRSAFTPTDALHVLGSFRRWNVEAASLGAELVASEHGLTAEALCLQVVRDFSKRVCTELVSKVLQNEARQGQDVRGDILLAQALDPAQDHDLACTLTLHRPLVAIGAPVEAYMPAVAQFLHTELVIPPHAEVANAVGAVAGGVVQRLRVQINQLEDGRFRAHLPQGVYDADHLDDAVRRAEQVTLPHVEQLAREAGAEQIEVHTVRVDHQAPTARGGDVYLGTELIFTAAGRPSMVKR